MSKKYLITDPCYIVPTDDWLDFLDKTDYGNELFEDGYNIEGVGRIVEMSGTTWGDGSTTVSENGKTFEVGVDAGLVCIVELEDSFDLEAHCRERNYIRTLGAITDSEQTARDWFAQACKI